MKLLVTGGTGFTGSHTVRARSSPPTMMSGFWRATPTRCVGYSSRMASSRKTLWSAT